MGKKGKQAGRSSGKKGRGKARRERAAAIREIDERAGALIQKLEKELQGKDLFSPLAEREECPICFLPFSSRRRERVYQACCCQIICLGCFFTCEDLKTKTRSCAFCRSESAKDATSEETMQTKEALYQKRIEAKDTKAMNQLAVEYANGVDGRQKDGVASMRLNIQAAELGEIDAIFDLGQCYLNESIFHQNLERAHSFFSFAAKMGSVLGHRGLGMYFSCVDDPARALEHVTFAAKGGDSFCFDYLTHRSNHSLEDAVFDEVECAYKKASADEWSEAREKHRNEMEYGPCNIDPWDESYVESD